MLANPVSLDFETVVRSKGAVDPVLEFERLAGTRYSDSVLFFTDGARDSVSEKVSGIRLSNFTSLLSAELYSIFCTLKYAYRMCLLSATVFTDSLFASSVARSFLQLSFVVHCEVIRVFCA